MSNESTKDLPPIPTEDGTDEILLPTPTKTVTITHQSPTLIHWLQGLVWQAYQAGEGEMGTYEEGTKETWVFHFTAEDLAEQSSPSHFARDIEDLWIFCQFDEEDELILEWDGTL